MQPSVSIERIRELLDYNPITGKFHWKVYRNSLVNTGDEAGHINFHGHVMIGIDKGHYLAHRVAWLMTHGVWPKHEIDHINHNRADNRITNLRSVTRLQNQQNKSKSVANTSGHTGVYQVPSGRWLARICVDRKMLNLGTFKTVDEALLARQTANTAHNFHSNHGL